MKPRPPTRADKRHLEELLELINDAYVDGKPVIRALEAIQMRRWEIEGGFESRLIKAKRRAAVAEARVAELEAAIVKHVEL